MVANAFRNALFPVEPKRSGLLRNLWERQNRDRCISDTALDELAGHYGISKAEVEGVASFYHFFHRQPSGRHTIYINNSMPAVLKGHDRILDAFIKETGAPLNGTDPTDTFGIFETPCIGFSDQEPSALIDFHPFTHLNAMKIRAIVQQLRAGATAASISDDPTDTLHILPVAGRSLFFAEQETGRAIKNAATAGADSIIEQLRIADLSGRGGAFFPTWKKWQSCRTHTAKTKFIVCNADEGEPGTFKDRVLLHKAPGTVLEGMIIAGFTVGAAWGIIYLRGEYRWLVPLLEKEIDAFHAKGMLGNNVCGISGFDFHIRIEVGAGAYVCGEETALLESMEGKRGEPRTKWYFPAERGYLQYPTLVNNVETFAAVTRLFQLGRETYLQRGIPGSPGTKLISVSGDCLRPGLYEIEWGLSVENLLQACGAEDPHFIQVSGPSGECISEKEKFRKISMVDLLGEKNIRCGGSFMIFNRDRDLVKILLNFCRFFKHESCGVCTPCRAGNFIIEKKLERLEAGLADTSDLKDLRDWSRIMRSTSRCGLGRTSTNTVLMALEKFADVFQIRTAGNDDQLYKAFDREAAIAAYERYKP